MNDEVNVKAVDFSLIQLGGKFFMYRTGTDEYTKMVSTKNENGTWSNAKNKVGSLLFVKYDARVWVRT